MTKIEIYDERGISYEILRPAARTEWVSGPAMRKFER